MHLAVLVVSHRVLLQLFGDSLVVDYFDSAVTNQLNDIEQLTGISSAVPQERIGVLDFQS